MTSSWWCVGVHCQVAGRCRDGTVFEAQETVVGDCALEALRGQEGAGRVAMWRGLTMTIPRDGPPLGGYVLQQAGLAHVVFEDSSGDGGEGFGGDKAVGSGGAPGCAGFCDATARHNGVHVGVVRQRPPQVGRTPRKPGKWVPMKRLSWASCLRAVEDAWNIAWYARR
jgi:hypothetical protein